DEGLRAALELRRTHPGTAVLVLSQYIETRYAAELLHGSPAGAGYLLKDRVADVNEFADAVGRVAAGGNAPGRAGGSPALAGRRPPGGDRALAAAAGGRGARPEGGGPPQPRHPRRPAPPPRHGREARPQHLPKAGRARLGNRQPPRPGRPALPRLLIGARLD